MAQMQSYWVVFVLVYGWYKHVMLNANAHSIKRD
jgi:ribosomal protein L15E